MKIWVDYIKVLSVIDSCNTTEQLKSAAKFLALWYDKYLDYPIYRNTFSGIEEKFFDLGGVDSNELFLTKNKDENF
jgi:hypothetical protein